jgi:ATP-dependent Lon protease
MNDNGNKNSFCDYIYKKGDKKGSKCNVMNCTLHVKNTIKIPGKIAVSPDKFLIQLPKQAQAPQAPQAQQQAQQQVPAPPTQPTVAAPPLPVISEIEKLIKNKLITSDLASMKQKILDLETDIDNKTVLMKHYLTLRKLDPSSTEYYKNQHFIESALNIRWNHYYNVRDALRDQNAKDFIQKLSHEFDDQIFGMENVKNEIINYICKFITNPDTQKNNIALYGSAGVCKTKFIKILSKVLGLPMKVISLGGVKDSSYFLGHNFTYVESNYGAIIQSIIDTKIMNPILYFDELDKISVSDTGKDIYSVLSNLTDPTVNNTFTDHYFRGLTFDLSRIFYVFTFNDISKIDKVLLDRLNIIHVETPSKANRCKILSDFCLKEIVDNIKLPCNITFDERCYMEIVSYVEKQIDLKVSSGVRESIRILEKIVLEINKEILCNPDLGPGPELKEAVLHIDYTKFKVYFNKLKAQFLILNTQNDAPPEHMYI